MAKDPTSGDGNNPKIDAKDVREMEVSFGVAKKRGTEKILTCAKVTIEGKKYLGIGTTREEALKDALQQAFPELKEVKLAPQIAWNPLWKDMGKPVTMDEVDPKGWKSAKELLERHD